MNSDAETYLDQFLSICLSVTGSDLDNAYYVF